MSTNDPSPQPRPGSNHGSRSDCDVVFLDGKPMITTIVATALAVMFYLGYRFACTRYHREIKKDEWRRM